nr:MAG TPA: hypothetical protein [Caudoviricetes sp.]
MTKPRRMDEDSIAGVFAMIWVQRGPALNLDLEESLWH